MNQKGFSLIEVLFSLILLTTVAFGLLREQAESRQLIHQLMRQAGATAFLDQVEEYLLIHETVPLPSPPDKLKLKPMNQNLNLEYSYFHNKDPLIRHFFRSISSSIFNDRACRAYLV